MHYVLVLSDMSEKLTIDKSKTAIVVIDLQKGIASMPARPHAADLVVANAAKLVNAFRKDHMPVFLVHVINTPETMLKVISDESFQRPPGSMPPDWAEFVPQIAPIPSDIIIAKKQWGAFYGTDLDLQLRRRRARYDSALRHSDRLWCREHGQVRL